MTSISTTVNFNLALGRSIQQCISEIGADAPLRVFCTVIPSIPRFMFVGWAGGGGFRNLELVENARGLFPQAFCTHFLSWFLAITKVSCLAAGWCCWQQCRLPPAAHPREWKAPTSNPASNFQWLPYNALEVRFCPVILFCSRHDGCPLWLALFKDYLQVPQLSFGIQLHHGAPPSFFWYGNILCEWHTGLLLLVSYNTGAWVSTLGHQEFMFVAV